MSAVVAVAEAVVLVAGRIGFLVFQPLQSFFIKVRHGLGQISGGSPGNGVGYSGLADSSTGGYGFSQLAARLGKAQNLSYFSHGNSQLCTSTDRSACQLNSGRHHSGIVVGFKSNTLPITISIPDKSWVSILHHL